MDGLFYLKCESLSEMIEQWRNEGKKYGVYGAGGGRIQGVYDSVVIVLKILES